MDEEIVNTFLIENLFLIASEAECQRMASFLIFFMSADGIFDGPPTLSIVPDWRDTRRLLYAWAAEQGVEKESMAVPAGVGVWRVSLMFSASGTDSAIEDLAYRRLAQCVEEAVNYAKKDGER